MNLENRNATSSTAPHKHHHHRHHRHRQHHPNQQPRHHRRILHGLAAGTISVPLYKAWRIVSDFYGLASWVPTIRKCYEVRPGVRYAESSPGSDGKVRWVEEQLTSLYSPGHTLSYRIIAGNFGLQDYSATLQLSDSCAGSKTIVNWSFSMGSASEKTKEQQELYLRQGIQSLERAARRLM